MEHSHHPKDIEHATSPSPLYPRVQTGNRQKIVGQQHNISEFYRKLGLGKTAVRRWAAQYRAELNGQPDVGKPLTPDQQRIRQLEAELHIAKQHNEIPIEPLPCSPALTQMMLPIVSQLDNTHRQGLICRALDISRSGLHHARQHRDRPVCYLRTETLFKAVFADRDVADYC